MQQPIVLRSLEDLGETPNAGLPINRLATTYTMAQAATWVDLEHFAVGRWDGTISVFEANASTRQGATITTAVSAPSDQGVQMLEWIAPNTLISSNDASTMILWRASNNAEALAPIATLTYDASYGVANCASSAMLINGTILYCVTGHESGYALLWKGPLDGSQLTLAMAIDLRSATPVNPWGLQNIRGVQWFISDSTSIQFVTGSENGEICIVDVPSGNVLSRTVFNPSAKRGINALSALGQNLLVANCSVGADDKNLWYYWIDSSDWSVTLRDATNLIIDTTRAQVFNFDVTWGFANGNIVFYAATEEGALWLGSTTNTEIQVTGYEKVAVADLGAALAGGVGSLAYVAYNVSSFDTDPDATLAATQNPNRVPNTK